MAEDPRSLLILTRIPGVGPQRFKALVGHFGSPKAVLGATHQELIRVEGIEQKTARGIIGFLRGNGLHEARKFADDQVRKLDRIGGYIVSIWDHEYPHLLRRIFDPPPFLFVRGSFEQSDGDAIAMVGTRRPSDYGKRMADRLATGLAGKGITVVSGLARGIDTAAHSAAVRHGGRTVAVIGSGIDVIYPQENAGLAARMIEHGALVSEFEMGAKPDAVNFPKRNRIVSGMTIGTIVVETGPEGGAMITAGMALDQNREVFAVPGAVTEGRPSGAHKLIREGRAMLVESVDDVLSEVEGKLLPGRMGASPHRRAAAVELSLFERAIYDATKTDEPIHVDMLAQRTGMAVGELLCHLLRLECSDLIRQLPGKYFVRA
jgi:DNA processing protein